MSGYFTQSEVKFCCGFPADTCLSCVFIEPLLWNGAFAEIDLFESAA
jgi:hypothetical protein